MSNTSINFFCINKSFEGGCRKEGNYTMPKCKYANALPTETLGVGG
jgi:hypothetical protein